MSKQVFGFKREEEDYDVVWCENGQAVDDGLTEQEQVGVFDKYFNNVGFVRKFNVHSEFGAQKAQEGMVAMFGDLGYKVEFQADATPCVNLDEKVVMFPIMPEDISVEAHKLRRCWTDHENAHILFTDKRVNKPEGRLGDLLNIIEDGRIEREFGKQYAGVKMNLEYGNDFHGQELMARLDADDECTQQKRELCEAFMALKHMALGSPIEDILDGHPNTFLEKLKPIKDDFKNLKGGKGTGSALQLAKKVDDIWGGASKDEDRDNALKELLKELGKGQIEEAEKKGGESEDEEGGSSKGLKFDKPTLGGDDGGEAITLSDKMREELQDELGDSIDVGPTVKLGNPTDYESHGTMQELYNSPRGLEHMGYEDLGKWTAEMIASEVKEAKVKKDYYSAYKVNDKIHTPKHTGNASAEQAINKLRQEARSSCGVMINKLVMHLKSLKPTWTRNQEKGQLDDRVLAKVGVGSKRLFRQRQPQEQIDTAISMIIDMSGSMTGSKATLAVQSALVFSDVLEALNVPHEILGFTTTSWDGERTPGFTRTIPIEHIVFKTFDEKIGTVRNRLSYALTCDMKHNVDGEALQWAGARISQRNEKRKVIMVMSDGYPEAGYSGGNLRAHLIKTVKEVEGKGIGCIGVGILSDAVSRFYKDHAVCSSLESLPGEVLGKLKQVLTRLG